MKVLPIQYLWETRGGKSSITNDAVRKLGAEPSDASGFNDRPGAVVLWLNGDFAVIVHEGLNRYASRLYLTQGFTSMQFIMGSQQGRAIAKKLADILMGQIMYNTGQSFEPGTTSSDALDGLSAWGVNDVEGVPRTLIVHDSDVR